MCTVDQRAYIVDVQFVVVVVVLSLRNRLKNNKELIKYITSIKILVYKIYGISIDVA